MNCSEYSNGYTMSYCTMCIVFPPPMICGHWTMCWAGNIVNSARQVCGASIKMMYLLFLYMYIDVEAAKDIILLVWECAFMLIML